MVDFRRLPFQYQQRAKDIQMAASDEIRSKFGEQRDQDLENYLAQMFALTPVGFGYQADKEFTLPSSFSSVTTDWDSATLRLQAGLPKLMGPRQPVFDAHGNAELAPGFYAINWEVQASDTGPGAPGALFTTLSIGPDVNRFGGNLVGSQVVALAASTPALLQITPSGAGDPGNVIHVTFHLAVVRLSDGKETELTYP